MKNLFNKKSSLKNKNILQDKEHELQVKKRNGSNECVSFDKILNRVKILGNYNNSNLNINYTKLVIKIIDQLYDGIETSLIDELTAQQCASMTTVHPDYGILASRILISNHHKNTEKSFTKVMEKLYNFKDIHGESFPKVNEKLYNVVLKYGKKIDKMIDYSRDYNFDYFGFKTLERAYLMRYNNIIVERPQHMWMRVSIGIHGTDLEKIKETYDLMSEKYFTHATPTLFNAGTPRQQLSSCYLIAMEDDSVKGIYNTLTECALISKYAGGIGLHIHNVRGKGTHIRGTNGYSNGIVPMLRTFNSTARYIDQCVTPDTYIYTTQGVQKIGNVIKDETRIFNDNGTTEVIQDVLEHKYNDYMTTIKTTHSLFPLKVTDEHPILGIQTNQHEIGLNNTILKNKIERNIYNIDWIETKDITKQNTLIAYKIPSYEKNIISLSENDCYFYGIMLGCGIYDKHDYTGKCRIFYNNNTYNNNDVFDFLKHYFSEKCINYDDLSHKSSADVCIHWEYSLQQPIRHADLYNEKGNKHIQYKWLNLPINKSKYILKGILNNSIFNKHLMYFEFKTHSLPLILGMRYLCLKQGILTKTNIEEKQNDYNNKIEYTIKIPLTKELIKLGCLCDKYNYLLDIDLQSDFLRYDNYLFTRVEDIKKEYYVGIVYDLQMNNIHNYMLDNGIVHNGGGKRAGSFAMYIETWHKDIEDFLQMKKNHGDEELKARDLFYALWISDLFMKRVNDNENWTLMCPDKCRGLQDKYGDEFEKLYIQYENEGKGDKTIPARKIWFDILDSQIETGTPYILFKDHANRKSNQKNLGTIKSSNLCVAPETTILTKQGDIAIETLENKNVEIWNGKQWSNVVVRKTSDYSVLMKIMFSNGKILECTPYHKFYIDVNGDGSKIEIIPAMNLQKNMKLMNYTLSSNPQIQYNNIYVSNIVHHNRYDKTYCFTEPLEHKGIFNGILTGQCSEIIEYSNEHETAVCNLASIGLSKFVEDSPNLQILKTSLQNKQSNTNDISNNKNNLDELNDTTNCDSSSIIQIYSKSKCPYCTFAKNLLKKYNLQYEEINCDDDDFRLNFYKKVEQQENGLIINTVPQIYINDKRIGGYKELSKYLNPVFNYKKLHEVTKIITNNLNNVIDINFYPTEKTRRSNLLHRPIGIGVQGLADVFALMNLPYDSKEAKEINEKIFETIYHAALEKSNELSIERKEKLYELYESTEKWDFQNRRTLKQKKLYIDDNEENITEEQKKENHNRRYIEISRDYYFKNKKVEALLDDILPIEMEELLPEQYKGCYSSFVNSPASQGILQFDMWNIEPKSGMYNWNLLKESIKKHGLRNSLLVAPMPTASTSQILGNNECFEPFTSNIYTRRTLAGEFVVINKHLLKELIELDLWNEDIKNLIIAYKGSIQNIDEIPKYIKDKYKIAWEIPMKTLIDMSRDRGAYVCQSQSLNLWMENPTYKKLTSMHFYSWKQGLKTGIYYLRTKASASAQQFTIDPKLLQKKNKKINQEKENSDIDEGCLMCSG